MRFGLRAAPGRLVQRLFIHGNSPEPIRHVSRDSACFSVCRRVFWITRSAEPPYVALIYPQNPLKLDSARFPQFRLFFCAHVILRVATQRWTFSRSTARSDEFSKPSPTFFPRDDAYFGLRAISVCLMRRLFIHRNIQSPFRRIFKSRLFSMYACTFPQMRAAPYCLAQRIFILSRGSIHALFARICALNRAVSFRFTAVPSKAQSRHGAAEPGLKNITIDSASPPGALRHTFRAASAFRFCRWGSAARRQK